MKRRSLQTVRSLHLLLAVINKQSDVHRHRALPNSSDITLQNASQLLQAIHPVHVFPGQH
jgi:hypothetical protein